VKTARFYVGTFLELKQHGDQKTAFSETGESVSKEGKKEKGDYVK